MTTNRITVLTTVLFALAGLATLVTPAAAQVATFDGGSIYDLDPPAQQSTLGEQLLSRVASQRQRGAMQYVRQLGPGDVLRTLARPVGRIAFSGDFGANKPKVGYCTASLIADDLVLTNYHCIAGNPLGKVADALLWMGYLRFKDATGVKQYGLELDPVEASAELDYAIHRVRGAPGKDWGRVRLAAADPGDNTSLFIVHHPGGQDQHISLGACKTSAPALAGEDFLHECATEVGSSGAPVFDFGRRTVIGLHYAGVSDLKAAKRMAAIAERSATLRGLMVDEAPRQSAPAAKAKPEPALVWPTVKDSTSPGVLEAFAAEYPGTIYARLATARAKELEGNSGEIVLLMRGALGITDATEIAGAAICMANNMKINNSVLDFLRRNKLETRKLYFSEEAEAVAMYHLGRCDMVPLYKTAAIEFMKFAADPNAHISISLSPER